MWGQACAQGLGVSGLGHDARQGARGESMAYKESRSRVYPNVNLEQPREYVAPAGLPWPACRAARCS